MTWSLDDIDISSKDQVIQVQRHLRRIKEKRMHDSRQQDSMILPEQKITLNF